MGFPVITIRRHGARPGACCSITWAWDSLFAVIGGSMGGMQALAWAATLFPERVAAAVVIATDRAAQRAQNIAFHEVGRQAIMADPKWRGAATIMRTVIAPAAGLAVARMAAHITYLSEAGLTGEVRRASCRAAQKTGQRKTFGFDADFQVESYLRHQGISFVERFDANTLSLHHARARTISTWPRSMAGSSRDAFESRRAGVSA